MAITDPRIIQELYGVMGKGAAFKGSTIPSTAIYGSHYLLFKGSWYEITDKQAAIWSNMGLIEPMPRLVKAQGAYGYIPMKDMTDALVTIHSVNDTDCTSPLSDPSCVHVSEAPASSPTLQMIQGKIKKTGKK